LVARSASGMTRRVAEPRRCSELWRRRSSTPGKKGWRGAVVIASLSSSTSSSHPTASRCVAHGHHGPSERGDSAAAVQAREGGGARAEAEAEARRRGLRCGGSAQAPVGDLRGGAGRRASAGRDGSKRGEEKG
jgi:hypothetical protein